MYQNKTVAVVVPALYFLLDFTYYCLILENNVPGYI